MEYVMMRKLEEDFLLLWNVDLFYNRVALHVQSMFLVDCMAIYFSNDSFPPVEFFRQFTKLITRFLSYQNKVRYWSPTPKQQIVVLCDFLIEVYNEIFAYIK